MEQIKRNPDGANVRVAQNIVVLGRAIDTTSDSPNLLDLQAFRVRERYRVSWHVARVAAELAFENGRAA